MKAAELILCAEKRFTAAGIGSPRLDASVLLAHVLRIDHAKLIAAMHDEVAPSEESAFSQLVSRREKREPVAYILGKKEFWSLDVEVDRGVLIPRPETELVVEEALRIASKKNGEVSILDLCTGSGCIAMALAHELPRARMSVSDISSDAIRVARKNLHFAGERIRFFTGDIFGSLPIGEKFDVITSNPPYVAALDRTVLAPEITDFEPDVALYSGDDGLDFIRRMIKAATAFLSDGGTLVFEFGMGQSESIVALAKDVGFSDIKIFKDLSGIERAAVIS